MSNTAEDASETTAPITAGTAGDWTVLVMTVIVIAAVGGLAMAPGIGTAAVFILLWTSYVAIAAWVLLVPPDSSVGHRLVGAVGTLLTGGVAFVAVGIYEWWWAVWIPTALLTIGLLLAPRSRPRQLSFATYTVAIGWLLIAKS